MADQFFRNFNLQQGFGETLASIVTEHVPLVAMSDAPRIGYSQLQYLSLEDHFPPPSIQGHTRTYGDVGEPCLWPPEFESIWPLPRQIPEAGSQIITAPDWSDWNCWNGFGALANGQICADSWRPGQGITDLSDDKTLPYTGDHPLGQSINSPFIQGDGIQSQFPILFCDDSHGQSPKVSVLQSEFTPYLSPISPCQPRAAPNLDPLSFEILQYASETQNTKRSTGNRRGTATKAWPCPQKGCNKKYNRSPYLIRHIRDRHMTRRKCPFCVLTWTRADVIQKHLRTEHQEQFTEEGYRELLGLQGWDGTIRFVAKCGRPMPHSNNITGAWGPGVPALSLIDVESLGGIEPDDRNVV